MPGTRPSDRGVVLSRGQRRPQQGFVEPVEDSDDETEYSEDLVSVGPSDLAPSVSSSDPGNPLAMAAWGLDLPRDRSKIMDDFANKHLHPEETALMIKKFQKATDVPFSRTYQMGVALRTFSGTAHTPHVALVLLPGADLPEVNRMEQNGMVSQLPDQRDSAWRVNTAGGLLINTSVAKDLSLIVKDVTPDVAANAHRRLQRHAAQSQSALLSFRKDAVTIDSDNVEVVHQFSNLRKELDLSATLMEVNVSSLFALMHDYRYIISNSGSQMTFQQTKGMLDRMIESARRFCVRSPILFRMSTRTRIINSSNTRYGVDNEHSFTTFTTSKGIQEIIMMSASYFNSLDPNAPGMDRNTQSLIRPRFLQMLTLLLSLLNNNDLKEMAGFLETTYGIIPERQDMELLFLKVIPLTSINPKVFLQGLIPAVDQWPVPERAFADGYEKIWKNFMKRLAQRGYLLPGSVEDLGHRDSSWISRWPTFGINSSTVFSRLQHHGDSSKSFNEIPTARFSYEPELKELTVIMTNDETCIIHPSDYEQISTLTRGSYNVTKCSDNTMHDLEITEIVLNGAINEAVRVINDAIRKFNFRSGTPPRQKRSKWVWKPRPEEPIVFPDVESAARLTRNQATLNGDLLAVAYKLNGRSVPKTEAIRYMSYSYTRVKTLFGHLCEAAGRSIVLYEQHIAQVNQWLAADRRASQGEKNQPFISDAPISQALGNEDADIPLSKVWYDYRVRLVSDPQSGHDILHIQAKSDYIASVNWRRSGQQAEITLASPESSVRMFVAPLKPVSEAQQDDEIRVGDLALLVGRYIVIATPQANDFSYPCIMTNWLEIQDAYAEEVQRRGKNFEVKEQHPEIRFI